MKTRASTWPLAVQGLLLVVVATLLALPAFTDGTGYAGWPAIGFAVALLLVVPVTRRRWAAVALMVVATPALSLGYGVALPLGAVGALALVLSALFVATHLLGGSQAEVGDLVEVDSARFLVVTVLGALVNSLLPVALGLFRRTPLESLSLMLTIVLAVHAAQLVVLPLFLRTTDRAAAASHLELTVQRLVLVAAFLTVFLGTSTAGLAFLVLPALGWAAVRATQRETHVQVFLVGIAAFTMTLAGAGPFQDPAPTKLPDTLDSSQIYLYVLALCYGAVPLALAIDRLSTMTAHAGQATSMVERMLQSSAGTMFIATDAGGRITHFNAGAQQTLGYHPQEVLGGSPDRFHTPEEIARQASALGVDPDFPSVAREMVRRGTQREWEFVDHDGTRKMASLTLSAVRDPDGEVAGYIATGEDITDRLRAQDALLVALDRERASVVRLEEVDVVKQELVSNVSHELRTPITSISGYTELLADRTLGDLNDGQLDAVQRIERNTSRLGLLVEDLLLLSRAESDQLDLEPDRVDLREVVTDSLELLGDAVSARVLEVRTELPEHPVEVLGDPHALERVVTNLVGNAIKFTPDQGQVVVSLQQVPGPETPLVRLEVSDTGMGISEEDQDRLFTRFFRASTATEQAIQGTGLGLSIVNAIVTQHHGDVQVRSAPGRGTTMTVLLPAYAEPAAV